MISLDQRVGFLLGRAIASPMFGSFFGGMGGGIGVVVLVPFQVDYSWNFVELLMALIVTSLIGAVHGVYLGAVIGLISIPLLLVFREKKWLDTLLCATISGIIAYVYFDFSEQTSSWKPHLLFIVPRVMACLCAEGAIIWFLGRSNVSA